MKRKVYGRNSRFCFTREVTPQGAYRYVIKSLRWGWMSFDEGARVFQVVPQSQWRGNELRFAKFADANRAFLMLTLAS